MERLAAWLVCRVQVASWCGAAQHRYKDGVVRVLLAQAGRPRNPIKRADRLSLALGAKRRLEGRMLEKSACLIEGVKGRNCYIREVEEKRCAGTILEEQFAFLQGR